MVFLDKENYKDNEECLRNLKLCFPQDKNTPDLFGIKFNKNMLFCNQSSNPISDRNSSENISENVSFFLYIIIFVELPIDYSRKCYYISQSVDCY